MSSAGVTGASTASACGAFRIRRTLVRMSGPVEVTDIPAQPSAHAVDAPAPTTAPPVEVVEGRSTTVGSLPVRRVLPRRGRRTVGAWCFVDHMGPVDVTAAQGVD